MNPYFPGFALNTQNAVVNCSVYKKGKKLKDTPLEDISDVLADKGTFVGVGLREPDNELLKKMQEEFGLHELAFENTGHSDNAGQPGPLAQPSSLERSP